MNRIWTPEPEHYKAKSWCIDNDIKVFPKPRNGGFILVYVIDGIGKSSYKVHDRNDYQRQWWDFYLYLYQKYCND
jgi:hypothetical protein